MFQPMREDVTHVTSSLSGRDRAHMVWNSTYKMSPVQVGVTAYFGMATQTSSLHEFI